MEILCFPMKFQKLSTTRYRLLEKIHYLTVLNITWVLRMWLLFSSLTSYVLGWWNFHLVVVLEIQGCEYCCLWSGMSKFVFLINSWPYIGIKTKKEEHRYTCVHVWRNLRGIFLNFRMEMWDFTNKHGVVLQWALWDFMRTLQLPHYKRYLLSCSQSFLR